MQIKKALTQNFTKQLVKEMDVLFKETEDKTIKERAKEVKKLEGIHYKEQAYYLAEALEKIDAGLVGKKAAFLSKELATIETAISCYRNVDKSQLALSINHENMRKIFARLQFHSIAV